MQKKSLSDKKINYQQELNPEQLEVVFNADGPCLVLAGAGSGKTKTLVYRLTYLLEKGIPADNIMLLTFTNKASKEMLFRASNVWGEPIVGLWGGTFHHIGNRFLRLYGNRIGINNNFTILDETDSLHLLKTCLKEIRPSGEKDFPKPKIIRSIISLAINLGRKTESVVADRYGQISNRYIDSINQVIDLYQQKKRANNLLDFDDLLDRWLELLLKDSALASFLGKKFQYILVDEFQDTNYLQHKIITHLANPQRNVLVVGDDSQSIYGFRGADVNNILDFPKHFVDAKMFYLSTNYRSTPEILSLANHSIENNNKKFDKKLSAVSASGTKPFLFKAVDNYEQANKIVEKIIDLHDSNNYRWSDIAVLFRSHFQSLELEMELNKRQIPYQLRGGLKFFEQAHLKDISAYLRLLINHKDEIAWRRLLALQSGIGEATIDKILKIISDLNSLGEILSSDLKLSSKALLGWRALVKSMALLVNVESDNLSELISIILDSGYDAYLRSNFENYQERLEDLEQLMTFIDSYESLETFLADTALTENFQKNGIAKDDDNQRDQVVLSTIHQAKGLEWRAVFVISLAEGLFPHAKTYDRPAELEEERRLFYVAVTRARENLYLTLPLFSRDNQLTVSAFIKELPFNDYQNWGDDFNFDSDEVVYVDEDQEYKNQLGGKNKKKILDFDANFDW